MRVIGIDVGREETKFMNISLYGGVGNNDQPVVKEVKGGLKEQAQYFANLIELDKPLKVIIDTRGFEMGLLDYLMDELEKRNIYLDKSGNVAYRN